MKTEYTERKQNIQNMGSLLHITAVQCATSEKRMRQQPNHMLMSTFR